jgi:uncharacterized protein YndB with AHSA1/START domain
MIKIVLITLAVLVAGVLLAAAARPDVFRVERTASIKAPPEKIFAAINDFGRWAAWSPYEKKDPAMKRTRSGPASGKGAVYAWEGNNEVGAGRMEITDASAPARVVLNLDFTRPMEAHNVVEFTLDAKGGDTKVTWAMRGPVPYFAKIVHLFIDMDRMVGTDFEAGLANLKTISES